MKDNLLNFGIIGCGRHAQLKLLPSLKYVPGIRLVALCDSEAGNLEKLRHKYKVNRIYTDYQEMLGDHLLHLDALLIATPSHTHSQIAKSCIVSGVHTFIEKPLATSLEEARELLNLQRQKGVKVMVGHQRRFGPLENSLVDLFKRNLIGKPVAINSIHNFSIDSRAPLSGYLSKRESGGGVILEYACHDIDFLRYLLKSEVKQIYAQVASNYTDDDTAILNMEFDNGVLANLLLCSCTVDSEVLEVFGSEGRIKLDRYQTVKAEVDLKDELRNRKLRALKTFLRGWQSLKLARYIFYKNILKPYIEELRHFVDCIEQDREPLLSLQESITTLEVILFAFDSVRSGKPIKISRDYKRNPGA